MCMKIADDVCSLRQMHIKAKVYMLEGSHFHEPTSSESTSIEARW
jgi:hypothetical protein